MTSVPIVSRRAAGSLETFRIGQRWLGVSRGIVAGIGALPRALVRRVRSASPEAWR